MQIEAKNLVVTAALVMLGSMVAASSIYYVMNKNFEVERATFDRELQNIEVIHQQK